MMSIITKLKRRYTSIIADRAGGVASRSVGRSWQILLVGFGVTEVIFLALVVVASYQLDKRQPAVASPNKALGGVSSTIDRERLQGLLDQFERKAATHEDLRLAAPSRVDPSVRSWYGEGDEAQ